MDELMEPEKVFSFAALIIFVIPSNKIRNSVSLCRRKLSPPAPCINRLNSDPSYPFSDLEGTLMGRCCWRMRCIPMTGRGPPVRSGAWLFPRGSAGNKQKGGTTEHCENQAGGTWKHITCKIWAWKFRISAINKLSSPTLKSYRNTSVSLGVSFFPLCLRSLPK